MAIFWQARPPQWGPHQRRAAAATAVFYSAKSRQGLGLGGLASRGSPVESGINLALRLSIFGNRPEWLCSICTCPHTRLPKFTSYFQQNGAPKILVIFLTV